MHEHMHKNKQTNIYIYTKTPPPPCRKLNKSFYPLFKNYSGQVKVNGNKSIQTICLQRAEAALWSMFFGQIST